MDKTDKKQALESVELIRQLASQTREDMYSYRADLICYIWGVFTLLGFSGQRWLFHFSRGSGLWWAFLSIAGFVATFFVIKAHKRPQPKKQTRHAMKGFLFFWIPFILLAYVLALFCMLSPDIHPAYIAVVFMLVVSTGFMIIGLLFYRVLFFMGCLGFASAVISGIYFVYYADIFLGLIFGLGLIVTGLVSRKKESSLNRGFYNFI
ncbi:MAG: hypothetical protein JXB26_08085 [Candidatus Aminicenantes bacterium]|nr:hypothetical protein [Candidatus Aminicenantes bacterium]